MGTISVSCQNKNYLSKHTTNHKNFGAEVKTRVTVAQSSFKSKAKMTNFAPNILPTFYWFSDTLSCTLQHIKNLAHTFFVSARYRRFSLSTWSKMKNFDPKHKNKSILLLWFGSKFFIFDHVESENLWYLAETKKVCAKFFICCKVHENVSENH